MTITNESCYAGRAIFMPSLGCHDRGLISNLTIPISQSPPVLSVQPTALKKRKEKAAGKLRLEMERGRGL
jgi:hypothetical protein